MSSTIGNTIRYTLFGASHGPAIGMTIDGLPAGLEIDQDLIGCQLTKRKTGVLLTSQRRESDTVEWLSGLLDGRTTGAAVTFIIKNNGQNSQDYKQRATIMRPSHADYTANVKYKGYNDARGGGIFSGRMTACFVVAGTIVRQLLTEKGISIYADIINLGELQLPYNAQIKRDGSWLDNLTSEWRQSVIEYLDTVSSAGDSLGGTVRVMVSGMPVGIGEPPFESIEAILAQYLWAIPGLKAIGFGDGVAFAAKKGSQVADQMQYIDGVLRHLSNHNGGVLGGISNGEMIQIDCTFKATPSLFCEQETVDLDSQSNVKLKLTGQHDPAFVIRTPIIVESVIAMALYDLWRAAQ